MECVQNNSHDSYTRYRTMAVAAMPQTALRENAGNLALLMVISAFWGYVLFVMLGAIL
jgi:hypothetical protein